MGNGEFELHDADSRIIKVERDADGVSLILSFPNAQGAEASLECLEEGFEDVIFEETEQGMDGDRRWVKFKPSREIPRPSKLRPTVRLRINANELLNYAPALPPNFYNLFRVTSAGPNVMVDLGWASPYAMFGGDMHKSDPTHRLLIPKQSAEQLGELLIQYSNGRLNDDEE